jgi:hypothetical protein
MADFPTKIILSAVDNTDVAFRNVRAGIAQINTALGGMLGPLAAITSVAGFGKLIANQIELGDQLSKTSQKLGVSVENLSAYQYAAKLSGVSNEELTSSLAKLGKAVQESLENPASKTAATFRALGISQEFVKNNANDTGVIFEEVARKLNTFADGGKKSTAEMILLGKSGFELAPLINSLEETTAEARSTGNVISTDFAKSAERFNDEITRMELSLNKFLATSKDGPTILNGLFTALKSVEFVAIGLGQGFEELGTEIGAVSAASVAVAKLNFSEARAIMKMMDEDIDRIQKRGEAARAVLFADGPKKAAAASGGKDARPDLNVAGDATASDAAKTESLSKLQSQMDALFRRSGDEMEQRATKYVQDFQTLQALRKAKLIDQTSYQMKSIELADGYEKDLAAIEDRKILEPQAKAQRAFDAETAAAAGKLAAIQQGWMTEKELENQHYAEQQFDLMNALNMNLLTKKDYDKAEEEAELRHQAKMGNVKAQAALAERKWNEMNAKEKRLFFTQEAADITGEVATQNKTMFKINKAMTLANLALSAPDAIGKAIAAGGGLPWGAVFGILTAAKYAILMSSAQSADFGGSTSPPSIGGGSAIPTYDVGNSQSIPQTTPVAAAAPKPTVNIQLVGDTEFVSRDWLLNKFIPTWNEAFSDGANINVIAA